MFDYISSTAAFHFIWSFTIVNEAGIIKMSPSFNSECSPTQKLTSIMTIKHILYLNFAMTISSLLINFWRDNLRIYCATDEWFKKKIEYIQVNIATKQVNNRFTREQKLPAWNLSYDTLEKGCLSFIDDNDNFGRKNT